MKTLATTAPADEDETPVVVVVIGASSADDSNASADDVTTHPLAAASSSRPAFDDPPRRWWSSASAAASSAAASAVASATARAASFRRREGRSIRSDDIGVELKGVSWRSAFTTRARSYGEHYAEVVAGSSSNYDDRRDARAHADAGGRAAHESRHLDGASRGVDVDSARRGRVAGAPPRVRSDDGVSNPRRGCRSALIKRGADRGDDDVQRVRRRATLERLRLLLKHQPQPRRRRESSNGRDAARRRDRRPRARRLRGGPARIDRPTDRVGAATRHRHVRVRALKRKRADAAARRRGARVDGGGITARRDDPPAASERFQRRVRRVRVHRAEVALPVRRELRELRAQRREAEDAGRGLGVPAP
eukprot:30816-Pelagococcus_subviridis.AAC.4